MDGTYQWQDVADALNARMLQIGLTQRPCRSAPACH
jgi:hypothetical protein